MSTVIIGDCWPSLLDPFLSRFDPGRSSACATGRLSTSPPNRLGRGKKRTKRWPSNISACRDRRLRLHPGRQKLYRQRPRGHRADHRGFDQRRRLHWRQCNSCWQGKYSRNSNRRESLGDRGHRRCVGLGAYDIAIVLSAMTFFTAPVHDELQDGSK